MGGPKEPTVVAGIEFDALIERTEDHSATVPQYPVDAGYSVSDNVALSPVKLKLTLYVTATPVTWRNRHGTGEQRVESICNQLLSVYESRSLISVTTPYKSYSNMIINSISIKDTLQQGYAREIPVELTQVNITQAKSVAVPAEYARAGTTMEASGSASTSKAGSATTSAADRQSGSAKSDTTSASKKGNTMLYNLASGLGSKTGWYSLE